MKRTRNIKKADAILTGDWHLQDKQPVCRTDNFYEKQWEKLNFISDLQKKHNCPVWHSGDLFDSWKPSLQLLSKVMLHIPNQFWTIYGNHDLPQHNLDLNHKCGIYALQIAGKLSVFPCTHWGQEVEETQGMIFPDTEIHMLVWHVMTYQGKKPWPDCPDPKAAKLLRKYPDYDLILTGHNHKPFVEEYNGRLLVNPGSIFRTNADQQEHKPRVYLWYAETNTVEPVYLPIESGVISREHLEVKQERDERIDAFISTLNEDWEAKMSFEENIEEFRKINNISDSVMEIIYKAIEV